MLIHTEQEALFLACEMERTAVALYTRAIALMEQLGRQGEPLYEMLKQTLRDEEGHLCRFNALYQGLPEDEEKQLSLSAIAEGFLFEGGLMGAARAGLLKDAQSMLDLAIRSEADSAQRYLAFAKQAQSAEARAALLRIADEENDHLRDLHAHQPH